VCFSRISAVGDAPLLRMSSDSFVSVAERRASPDAGRRAWRGFQWYGCRRLVGDSICLLSPVGGRFDFWPQTGLILVLVYHHEVYDGAADCRFRSGSKRTACYAGSCIPVALDSGGILKGSWSPPREIALLDRPERIRSGLEFVWQQGACREKLGNISLGTLEPAVNDQCHQAGSPCLGVRHRRGKLRLKHLTNNRFR
jgi:hypothetical protein